MRFLGIGRKPTVDTGHQMSVRKMATEPIIKEPEPGKLKDERVKEIEAALKKALNEEIISPKKHKEMSDNLADSYVMGLLVYYWGKGQDVLRNSNDKVPIGTIDACFRLGAPDLKMGDVMQKVEEAIAGNLNMYLVQKNGIADLLFVKPVADGSGQ